MKTLKLSPVRPGRTLHDFIEFPKKLYAGNGQYVPDMDSDVRGLFDPAKNKALAFSELEGFVAYDGEKPVGRVLAIINHHANKSWKAKVARFGYFDFVDDKEVSRALLDAVSQWGGERGMDTIQGPLGLTDYDKEGMLMSDYGLMGSMETYYNYPYYPMHMEALGFGTAADWISIRVAVPKEIPQKYARVSKLSQEMFGFRVRTLSKKEIKQGYIYKVFSLLNEAFAPLFGFTPFTKEQAVEFMRLYLPVISMDMIPVVENDKGELLAIAITTGSLSHALRHSHGRLYPWGWYHLLRALKWKREDTVDLLLIAVRPDLQGLGLTAMLFAHLVPVYNHYGFRWAETGPQLVNNVKELSQWKALNPEYVKKRRCWEKKIGVKDTETESAAALADDRQDKRRHTEDSTGDRQTGNLGKRY